MITIRTYEFEYVASERAGRTTSSRAFCRSGTPSKHANKLGWIHSLSF